MPTVVELSIWIGVAGCRCPNSWRVSLMIFASFALKNNAPNSASAADDATNLNNVHRTWIAPFNTMGCPSLGIDPRK